MLYDPKREKPSLAGFVAWLATKNQNEEYNYCDCVNCAVAQYLKTMGLKWHAGYGVATVSRLDRIARDGPHRFGACLERALAAIDG